MASVLYVGLEEGKWHWLARDGNGGLHAGTALDQIGAHRAARYCDRPFTPEHLEGGATLTWGPARGLLGDAAVLPGGFQSFNSGPAV